MLPKIAEAHEPLRQAGERIRGHGSTTRQWLLVPVSRLPHGTPGWSPTGLAR